MSIEIGGALRALPVIRTEVNPRGRKVSAVKRKNSAQPKQGAKQKMVKRKSSGAARRRPKSGNKVVVFANPAKRRRRPTSSKKAHRRRRRTFAALNPVAPRRRRRAATRRASNPRHGGNVASGIVGQVIQIGRLAIVGAGSGVAVREATQFALGAKNTGWLGYLGNIAATVVVTIGVRMLGGTRSDAIAAAAGGGIGIIHRFTSETANPVVGQMSGELSGIGDSGTFGAGMRIRTQLRGLASAPAKLEPQSQPRVIGNWRPSPRPVTASGTY